MCCRITSSGSSGTQRNQRLLPCRPACATKVVSRDAAIRAHPTPSPGGDPMIRLNRREWFQTAAAGAALLAVPQSALLAEEKKAEGFTLPKLPYAYDALQPHIDAQTMEIHHSRHHK